MVVVRFTTRFKKLFSKVDVQTREKILKQVAKLRKHPETGKPMRNVRKGTRELHVPPFRLSYSYEKKTETVILLDFYHKRKQ